MKTLDFLDAAMDGDIDLLREMLEKDFDINATNSAGVNALACAVSENQIETVWFLVENGIDINASDCDGWTALYRAILDRNAVMTNFLLKSGINPNFSDHDGRSPLQMAVEEDYPEIVLFLARYAFKMDEKNKKLFSDFCFNANFEMIKS